MSKVSALYHIVFCTKNREMVIPKEHKEDLYRVIWAEIREHHCKLLRIGGIENHLHLLIELHPTIALSNLIRNIKAKSSGWIQRDPRFPLFHGWAKEYFAATLSKSSEPTVINYIKNQENHHKTINFSNELIELHTNANLDYIDEDMK